MCLCVGVCETPLPQAQFVGWCVCETPLPQAHVCVLVCVRHLSTKRMFVCVRHLFTKRMFVCLCV